MNIRVLSFTPGGRALSEKVKEALCILGFLKDEIAMYTANGTTKNTDFLPIEENLLEIIRDGFLHREAIIFIGAAGICVRGIAPFLKDKLQDPPVLCLDEGGKYVIPILSGHVGGANRLAKSLAEMLFSAAVITTATDVNSIFAVDEWASVYSLYWTDKEAAKMISAALLQGEPVGLVCDFPVLGELPKGIILLDREKEMKQGDLPRVGMVISLSIAEKPFIYTLHLIPKIGILGIGCRKGISKEVIKARLIRALDDAGISRYCLCAAASIDLKKEEYGLLSLCEELKIPTIFYTNNELEQVKGGTSHSEFVKSITGVDNVCEKAALLASEGGTLLIEKTAGDGVTIALAQKEWRVCFEY
jgi:cobalt-precorrin 5A hydrolase